MSHREAEPIFCSECQEEVAINKARLVNGRVYCQKDLAKLPLLARLRARKLPEDATRRGGKATLGMFTSLAALTLVIGVAFIWPWKGELESRPSVGVPLILASVFFAFFGIVMSDLIDILIDVFGELRRLNRR